MGKPSTEKKPWHRMTRLPDRPRRKSSGRALELHRVIRNSPYKEAENMRLVNLSLGRTALASPEKQSYDSPLEEGGCLLDGNDL
jgi:hypothetical protein